MTDMGDAAVTTPRLDDLAPGHWLKVDNDHKIVGCLCGLAVSEVDYDYGDEVVAHIVTVATAHLQAQLTGARLALAAVKEAGWNPVSGHDLRRRT